MLGTRITINSHHRNLQTRDAYHFKNLTFRKQDKFGRNTARLASRQLKILVSVIEAKIRG